MLCHQQMSSTECSVQEFTLSLSEVIPVPPSSSSSAPLRGEVMENAAKMHVGDEALPTTPQPTSSATATESEREKSNTIMSRLSNSATKTSVVSALFSKQSSSSSSLDMTPPPPSPQYQPPLPPPLPSSVATAALPHSSAPTTTMSEASRASSSSSSSSSAALLMHVLASKPLQQQQVLQSVPLPSLEQQVKQEEVVTATSTSAAATTAVAVNTMTVSPVDMDSRLTRMEDLLLTVIATMKEDAASMQLLLSSFIIISKLIMVSRE